MVQFYHTAVYHFYSCNIFTHSCSLFFLTAVIILFKVFFALWRSLFPVELSDARLYANYLAVHKITRNLTSLFLVGLELLKRWTFIDVGPTSFPIFIISQVCLTPLYLQAILRGNFEAEIWEPNGIIYLPTKHTLIYYRRPVDSGLNTLHPLEIY